MMWLINKIKNVYKSVKNRLYDNPKSSLIRKKDHYLEIKTKPIVNTMTEFAYRTKRCIPFVRRPLSIGYKHVMRRTVLIMIGLVLLFFLVNWGLFVSYQQSDRTEVLNLREQLAVNDKLTVAERLAIQREIALKENIGAQIWSFCGTEAFKTVSVSILIALILASLGHLFKIDNAISERIRAEKQKRIDVQRDCIKKTSQMWNNLYGLVSEVRFYKEDGDKIELGKNNKQDEKEEKSIEDILMKLEDFAIQTEDIVNMWVFNFPKLTEIENKSEKIREHDLKSQFKKRKKKLKKEYRENKSQLQKELDKETQNFKRELLEYKNIRVDEAIMVFINIMYESATSVAYYIRKNKTNHMNIKITILQNALGVIQDVIKVKVQNPMISILKMSVEAMESSDSELQHSNRTAFQNTSFYLKTDARDFKLFEKKYNKLLPEITDSGIGRYRRRTKYFEKWVEKEGYRARLMKEYPGYDKTDTSRYHIRTQDLVDAWEIKYSTEYLLKLASYLGNFAIKRFLMDRVKWLQLQENNKQKIPAAML